MDAFPPAVGTEAYVRYDSFLMTEEGICPAKTRSNRWRGRIRVIIHRKYASDRLLSWNTWLLY